MIGGQESTRSTVHLAELFRLADQAGLLADPELATRRMKAVLSVRGVEAGCGILLPIPAGCRSTPQPCASRAISCKSSRLLRGTAFAPSTPGGIRLQPLG